jgi:hypothetical protein
MTPRYLALSLALLAACAIAAAPARAAGPSADYQIDDEYKDTSPDGKTIIEQYHKDVSKGDWHDWHWQFWARRGDTQSLINTDGDADYPAGFRFTNDGRFVLRTQKTGSGESSLYLYKLNGDAFISATKKPIGDLAWAYFRSLPESRKARKPDFHMVAGLIKGIDDNWRSLGVNWPENRYLVIGLYGEVEPTHQHHQLRSVRDWEVRYNLETGKFDVPPEFRADNADALDRKGENFDGR